MGAGIDHAPAQLAVHQHRFDGDLQPDHAGPPIDQAYRAGGGFLGHHGVALALVVDQEMTGLAVHRQHGDTLVELAVGLSGEHAHGHVQLSLGDGFHRGGGQRETFGFALELLAWRGGRGGLGGLGGLDFGGDGGSCRGGRPGGGGGAGLAGRQGGRLGPRSQGRAGASGQDQQAEQGPPGGAVTRQGRRRDDQAGDRWHATDFARCRRRRKSPAGIRSFTAAQASAGPNSASATSAGSGWPVRRARVITCQK